MRTSEFDADGNAPRWAWVSSCTKKKNSPDACLGSSCESIRSLVVASMPADPIVPLTGHDAGRLLLTRQP